MALDLNIHTALERHLRSYAEPKLIRVARQGYAFTPPVEEGYDETWNPIEVSASYLRTSFLPNRNERLLIQDPTHRRLGIYQIDVVDVVGRGISSALRLAGEVADHFGMDTLLTAGVVTVRITAAPSLAPPIIDAASMSIPVSVFYETLI
ncbi:phage tail terminator-like protein [Aureimonas fodinaquatilis]|nr:phage tail terminator-like protein [Aureimonas fodinaquatilis]